MSKLMRVLSRLLRMWYSSSKDSTSSLLYTSISSQASRFPFIHSTHNVCPGNLLCLLFFVVVQRLSVRYSNLSELKPNKLEYLTDNLCTTTKKSKHNKFPGHTLWVECMS